MQPFGRTYQRRSLPEIIVTEEGETINGEPISERRLLRSRAIHDKYCKCGQCDACLIWVAFKKFWKI
jgi:hypothetical protein